MRSLVAVSLAVLAAVPAALTLSIGQPLPVPLATLFYGLAIVGASFAMAWGAEAAEHDIPRALALTVVALLAVFPEYAVDIVFAFKAGQNPEFTQYAAANMTGSNRLLLGLGWPTISILAWLARGQRSLRLTRDAIMPLIFLGLATIYSFVLPIKANISVFDSFVLFALFLVYAALAAREETEEPDLVGPARSIGALRPAQRRIAIICLFAFAAVTIGACASPFADGLVHTGTALGIDEFLLVQWLAPLASEAPEFLVAILLALRGKPAAALGLLLASKLNQWTLLVGSLPLAYSLGSIAEPTAPGAVAALLTALPLDTRQVDEVWLTAAQSLFGLAVLASLSLELAEALLLAVLFLAQFVLGGILRASIANNQEANAELVIFSIVYVLLSGVFFFRSRRKLRLWLRPSKL